MSTDQFCYWLQGFNELVGKNPTEEQWRVIQDHLNLVFNKVTPFYPLKDTTYCSPTSSSSPQKLCNIDILFKEEAKFHNQLISC